MHLQASSSKKNKAEKVIPTVLKSQWFCKNFDINTAKLIGSGGFGLVFSAQSLKSEKHSAIKFLKVSPNQDIKEMMNEVFLISSLKKCNNVIQIEDVYMDTIKGQIQIEKIFADIIDIQIIFSMELGDGALDNYVNNSAGNKLKPHLVLQILFDCLNALIYASERNFSHSCIKPTNIIYFQVKNRRLIEGLQKDFIADETLIFKLSDWGLGQMRPNSTLEHSNLSAYSFGYVPPEILNNKPFNGNKADVFSLGMSLLLCCGIPFMEFKHLSGMSNQKKYERDLTELLDLLDEDYQILKPLLTQMLMYDMKERWDLKKLKDSCDTVNANVMMVGINEKEGRNEIKVLIYNFI